MEKEASKVTKSTNTKMSFQTDTGGTCCKPKKEESTLPNKEVVSDKKDVTCEAKSISTQLKCKISDKLDDIDTQKKNTIIEAMATSQITKSDKGLVVGNDEVKEIPKVTMPTMLRAMPVLDLGSRPLVLSVHLVPSLPISLFEIFAELIEAATAKPVVLLHESRVDRPVAKEVVDIAILPAAGDWSDGVLLPASFVFEHRLNKEFQPHIYGDVVVASDQAPYVKTIMDLRGSRCAFPNRMDSQGATGLLFSYLKSKGEGPSFFGSNLGVNSQIAVLHMITGKQVEVGVLESPVMKYYRNSLPGVEKLQILTSLGPLPPYRIMVHKDMPALLVNKITSILLKVNQDTEWIEKFSPYSVLGFVENTKSYYDLDEMKSVITSGPYY